MSDEFPPDEFDEIAGRGGPVGVHRAPRPWWTRLVMPILVFLLAGAVAFLIANYLWNQEVNSPSDSPTPTVVQSVTTTVTPTPSPDTSVSPTPTETAAPVDFDAALAVLNGAGIQGLAAKHQATLEEAGFTDVEASNLTGSKPEANVVVYEDDDMKSTAEAVAAELGISEVSQEAPRGSFAVEVWLVTDPAA